LKTAFPHGKAVFDFLKINILLVVS
jgi:hypothetical protein